MTLALSVASYASLVRATQAGSLAARDELAVAALPLLRSAAAKVVPAAAIDDVVHDAVLHLLSRIDQLRDPEAFVLWATRLVQSSGRSYRTTRVSSLDALPGEAHEIDLSPPPERIVLGRDECRRARLALNSVGQRDRDVLVARAVHEQSIPSLARRHGTTTESMSTIVHRARGRVVQALAQVATVLGLLRLPRPRLKALSPTLAASLAVLEIATLVVVGLQMAPRGVEGPGAATGDALHTDSLVGMVPGVNGQWDPKATHGTRTLDPSETADDGNTDVVEAPIETTIGAVDQPPPGEDITVVLTVGDEQLAARIYADEAEEASGEDVEAHVEIAAS